MDERWYGVRCIFRVGQDPDDRTWLYEERITLWRATSFEAATALAEADGDEYARVLGATRLGLTQAFLIGEEAGVGTEVFSLIRASALGPEPYLRRHFDTGTERQQQC